MVAKDDHARVISDIMTRHVDNPGQLGVFAALAAAEQYPDKPADDGGVPEVGGDLGQPGEPQGAGAEAGDNLEHGADEARGNEAEEDTVDMDGADPPEGQPSPGRR